MRACRSASSIPIGCASPKPTTAPAFYAYHLAEHHATPLGCASSPGLFLAAVAQRTTKLRFGPMVYLLPFYHPLRLIEEICMLDQMSGGRFEPGVGRGVSPIETTLFGLEFAQTQAMYHEAFQVLLKGLTSDELSFEGKFYRFDNVPMVLRPVQRPHPPLWYGVNVPDNAEWPAANDVNILAFGPREIVRPIFERYRATRRRLGKDDATLYGVGKHVVIADTDAQALAIARRAYPRWRASFRWLFERHGIEPRNAAYPPTFDELCAIDNGVAGSPQTVRNFFQEEVESDGAELSRRPAGVRRHDAGGVAALARSVPARGDACNHRCPRRRGGRGRRLR